MKNFVAGIVLLFGVAGSQAQTVKDPSIAALLDTEKYVEAFKQAETKLKSSPDDIDALTALAMSASNQKISEASKESALKILEACAEKLNVAVCHWGVGSIAGSLALEGGMLKAMRVAPKIKSAFEKSLQVDPLFSAGRTGLIQYYLMAPSIAGGSVSKAMETATAEQTRQPEHAKMFKAMVHNHSEAWAKAEEQLASMTPITDTALRDNSQAQWLSLAFGWLKEKQALKAKTVFERLQKDRPTSAYPVYGLGRAQTDLGQFDDAIGLLTRSATLKDADQLPIDYRMGIALQLKGDKVGAKAALTKSLLNKNMSSGAKKDAQKRLEEL